MIVEAIDELRAPFPAGIWAIDCEFIARCGEKPIPVCTVARNIFTGRTIKEFHDDVTVNESNLPVGDDALWIAFVAQAEWGCFLALAGRQLPHNVICLYAEYRNEISGRTPPRGRETFDISLLGAMEYYGLPHIAAAEKKDMRTLILRGHPYTAEERERILDYCQTDVECLVELLPAMMPMELELALYRGRFTKAVARIERVGIPIDREKYDLLIKHREELKSKLVTDFEKLHAHSPYVFVKGRYKFNYEKLKELLGRLGLLEGWKRTPKDRLKTSEDYLQRMSLKFPELGPVAALSKQFKDLRTFDLQIGSDGRSRFSVMPFASMTGRNQPKAKQFIFGQSSWLRGLLKPPEGEFVAYLDWSAAEFAIAAALSGDRGMIRAYESGDPYLRSAISMGFAPQGATKETHGYIRDLLKVWILATQYGATDRTLVGRLTPELAAQLRDPLGLAQDFLKQHRRLYRRYWNWANGHVELFLCKDHVEQTCFGWKHHLNRRLERWELRNKSLNFPVQATGAEILRWACVYATEAGIQVCATVHDALLVCGPVERAEDIVRQTKVAMDEASKLVLEGLCMRTDAKIVSYPDRFLDPRGEATWKSVITTLAELEEIEQGRPVPMA
jgi:hypothetical protein